MTRFRFRPRYRGIAWTSIGVGGSLAALATGLGVLLVPLVSGAVGVAFGAAYLASPAWRLAVTVDDAGLEVGSPSKLRFRVAWADIVKVVASPTTHTCYVDGGAPERSLLVPGVGASAPYAIENRAALYDAIVAHVAADRVRTVETLEAADSKGPALPAPKGVK